MDVVKEAEEGVPLVLPLILEYANSVCNPYREGFIKELEKV